MTIKNKSKAPCYSTETPDLSTELLKKRLKISAIMISLPFFLLAAIGLFYFQKTTNAFTMSIESIVTEVVPVTELKGKIQQTVLPFNRFINSYQLDDKTKFLQLSSTIKKSLATAIQFGRQNHSLSNDIYRSAYLNWRNSQRIANKIFSEVEQQKSYISYHLLQDFYQYVLKTTLALDKLHLAMQDRVNIHFQKAQEQKVGTLILIGYIFLLIYSLTLGSFIFLHRSITTPINQLVSWGNNFSRSKINKPLLLKSYQEFEFIATTYNELCQMLQDDQAVLEQFNQKDELTQLNNRRIFLQSLKTEHIRHQHYYCPFTIMLIDIDHMTAINQNYGKHIGDLSIIQISKLLENALYPTDVLCRYEADRFVIILPEVDKQGANITAEHTRNSISEHVFKIKDFKFGITVSIGFTTVQKSQPLRNELQCLDFSLQQAKQSGRNQVQYCSSEQNRPDNFKLKYIKESDLKLLD